MQHTYSKALSLAMAVSLSGFAQGASPSPSPRDDTGQALVSCAEALGAAAAQRRVAVCRNVSPATHPPCNVANSCASIENEIARSCALFDGQGTPMEGCLPSPTSQEAAVAVVRRYYSALNARDFDTAWALWGENGQTLRPFVTFKAGFQHTRETHVTIGPLTPPEGGAGSIYQTVPVTVDAILDNRVTQRFKGEYIVRRVNAVEGAKADQLRWHIDAAQLKPIRVK